MIKNIVFDMGQVLISFYPEMFYDRMGVPAGDREVLTREMFRGVEWPQLDRGTITEARAEAAICSRLPERLHGYVHQMVFDWWKPPLVPIEGMGGLVEELKGLGYGIYLLSNANIHLPEYFERIPGSRCFDGKLVSAQWKQLKPEREIYETLFREFCLKPEECFFVDDQPNNVEAARLAGMAGAVFHGDLARLRRELRAAGVAVREDG